MNRARSLPIEIVGEAVGRYRTTGAPAEVAPERT